MHLTVLVTALAAAGPAAAWPGMAPGGAGDGHAHNHARFHHGDMIKEIEKHAAAADNAAAQTALYGRSAPEPRGVEALLGDLVHLADEELTEVGHNAKRMLTGKLSAVYFPGHASHDKSHGNPPGPGKKHNGGPGKKHKGSPGSSPCHIGNPWKGHGDGPGKGGPGNGKSNDEPTSSTTVAASSPTSTANSPPSSSHKAEAPSSSSLSSSSSSVPPPAPSSSTTSSSAAAATTSTTSTPPVVASCSVWSAVARDMVPLFRDGRNGCSALARGAIRLGFHDAGAWNTSVPYGGADGSILLSPDELERSENNGLQAIANQTRAWYAQWHSQGINMADLIQFGSIVATVTCPLGPRVRFLAGRVDDTRAAVPDLLPSAFASAPALIELFAAKTISATDLVALVGAHSTSQQFFTDAATAGAAQDTTPGVWDTLFYSQTGPGSAAPPGVYRFPSDVALAEYSGTTRTWQGFAGRGGQGAWGGAYANAYFRLSLLGVSNINRMHDCSSAIP
ncbi:ligninase H2 [Niveomyces insectorum RCEF 264]|uniref:Peroxidase n=1 Tax=Niveomyces insectorum RCEF 264 TaxID=1081102 RepID=A0A167SRG6_9HYPO|nr:ligninase H2 [Niveomyces insectorum RCEF 264]